MALAVTYVTVTGDGDERQFVFSYNYLINNKKFIFLKVLWQ